MFFTFAILIIYMVARSYQGVIIKDEKGLENLAETSQSGFTFDIITAHGDSLKLNATISLKLQPINGKGTGENIKIRFSQPIDSWEIKGRSETLENIDCGQRRKGINEVRSLQLKLNRTLNDATEDNEARIVYGEPATLGDWPWQASIRVRGLHMCGGSLIAPKYILTASHCGFGRRFQASDMTVVLGTLSTKVQSPYQQTRRVVRITQNEGFNMEVSMNNDATVLELDSPVQYNQFVAPICLPSKPIDIDSLCFATGFGLTQNSGVEEILNGVMLPLVSHKQCSDPLWMGSAVTDNMICAGGSFKGACNGDSGGPLQCLDSTNQWILAGIVSWGTQICAQITKPGIFTNVYKYTDWIMQHVVN